MTDKTDKTNLIKPHGGYRRLRSYQMAEIVYDLTVQFCDRYMSYKINKSYRTYDQMVQAARSGKQNIAEGSQVSATSQKLEIKLISVARASLEELLQDYQDFLRQRKLKQWEKDHQKARAVRALAYRSNRSYETYGTYMTNMENAANCLICLINQANYLLDRQIKALERVFLDEGGFTERMYRLRKNNKSWDR